MKVRSFLIVVTLSCAAAFARAGEEGLAELPDVHFAAVRAADVQAPKIVPVALPNGQIVDHVFRYLSVQTFPTLAAASADRERVEKLLSGAGYYVVASGAYGSSPEYSNEIDYVPSAADFVAGHHTYESYTNGAGGNFLYSSPAQAETAMKAAVAAFEKAGYLVLDGGVQNNGNYYFGVTFMPPVR